MGSGPRILLIVGGGIAAYKSCELVRLIRKGGGEVTCVVTEGGQQFVTPMALAALSENPVYTSLFDLKNESEMGHIQLSRDADLLVVCPATADLLAKMAAGIADDLATTLMLATDKPVMAVPAMNVRMWEHEATQRNITWLKQAGVDVLHPDEGPMACGEFGYGRLPEPEAIWTAIAVKMGLSVAEQDFSSTDELAGEALEPEDEQPALDEHEERPGGLSGLLSAIIPRSTPKRSAEEMDSAFLDVPEEPEGAEEELPEAPVADLGSLLAKKGGANSAPPTDPEAINHMLNDDGSAPEPMDDDAGAFPHVSMVADDVTDGANLILPESARLLEGRHMLITAGPTWEAIDPVRYIGNRSSGRQGFSIAAAAAAMGAKVTLVAGPVSLQTPAGVTRVDVESAEQMLAAVKAAMPADIGVMVAAVADWKPKEYRDSKMKKRESAPPALLLTENPDILATIAASPDRPTLLVGFAAETDDVIANATSKRKRKATDWIVANDVSGDVMGGENNRVHIVSRDGVESLDEMPKLEVAMALVERMASDLAAKEENG